MHLEMVCRAGCRIMLLGMANFDIYRNNRNIYEGVLVAVKKQLNSSKLELIGSGVSLFVLK